MKQQKSMLALIAVIAAVVVTITLVMTTVATLMVPAAHASGSGVHYHLFNSGKKPHSPHLETIISLSMVDKPRSYQTNNNHK